LTLEAAALASAAKATAVFAATMVATTWKTVLMTAPLIKTKKQFLKGRFPKLS
jgi:hypothetical protein